MTVIVVVLIIALIFISVLIYSLAVTSARADKQMQQAMLGMVNGRSEDDADNKKDKKLMEKE